MAILAVFVEPAFSLETIVFLSHTNPYNSKVTQQCRRSYLELGLPVVRRKARRKAR